MMIYKTKDWIRLAHCLSIMSNAATLLSLCNVGSLGRLPHQRILKTACKALIKNQQQSMYSYYDYSEMIIVDSNGPNDIQSLRNIFDVYYAFKNMIVLLVKCTVLFKTHKIL